MYGLSSLCRRPLGVSLAVVGSILWSSICPGQGAPRPSPPGSYLGKADPASLARTAFRKDQPIVGTYYFYWYDAETKEHFVNPDGSDALTHHPLRSEGYSYRSSAWHRGELVDMLAAGIDFLLPVYWGYPEGYDQWSFRGIPPLVEAARGLEKEGRAPPRIGLFYDTSTLKHNHRGFHADLSTLEGKEWLYVSVRDFFSLVPPDLWATVEGQPMVWLYSASFARRQDPAALDHLRQEFERDFGVKPFIVKEVSWKGRADATYAWGAALQPRLHGVCALGPGYDHSAVPGRAPLVREREDGAFYERSWRFTLSREVAARPRIAILETWNEFHEGTEIAPTQEHKRQYLELTRRYADLWHAGKKLDRPGPFATARVVSAVLGEKNRDQGLSQREHADGQTRAILAAGRPGRRADWAGGRGNYLYFDVEDSFYCGDSGILELEFEFLDQGRGEVFLEYDSSDPQAPHEGAFKPVQAILLEDSGAWKTQKVVLRDAAFTGRSNGNDFRLSAPGTGLALHRVLLKKAGP